MSTSKKPGLKHSNGPWFVVAEEKGRKVWYVKNNTDTIAKVYNEHDARLIAHLFETWMDGDR